MNFDTITPFDTITVNGVVYTKQTEPSDLKIVVLQRGWVLIGRLDKASDTEHVLHSAAVIRYWGTTKGLGQLASEGPTDKTKLDEAGTVRYHPLSAVLVLDVDPGKWDR